MTFNVRLGAEVARSNINYHGVTPYPLLQVALFAIGARSNVNCHGVTPIPPSRNAKLFGSNYDAGIRPGSGSVISLCATSGSQLGGIYAADSTLISRCSSVANMTAGIFVQGAWTVQDCLVVGNAAGIAMDGGANRIDGNNVARSSPYPDIGSSASLSTSGQTVIIRNSVSKSILATSGVDIAPQGAAATVVSSWANLKQP